MSIDVSSKNRPSTRSEDVRKKHQRRVASSSAYPYTFDSFDRAFGKKIEPRDALTSSKPVADEILTTLKPRILAAAYYNPKDVRPIIMRPLLGTRNATEHLDVAGEVLAKAAHRGNAGLVNDLLTSFRKLGRDEGAIQAAVSSAAGYGSPSLVKTLLAAPANVGRHPHVIQSGFTHALYSDSAPTVKLFLEPPYNLGENAWARRQIENVTYGRKKHFLANTLEEYDAGKSPNGKKTLGKRKSKVFKRKSPKTTVLSRRQGQKMKTKTDALPLVITQAPFIRAERPVPAFRHADSLLRETDRIQNSLPVSATRWAQKQLSSLSQIKLPTHFKLLKF